ncbi:MAG: Cache 3/Cache 2 fusion domain-containing protein [Candidatus Binataceae bacterium]
MREITNKEASNLATLYRDLRGYPEPIKGRLRDELRDYTRYVIDESWPLQRRGIVPAEGSYLIGRFIDDLTTFEPAKKSEEILHAETWRHLNNFLEARRARLAWVNIGIPAVFWLVVVLGSFLTILMIAMMDMEIRVHLILGSAVSLFLGLTIFVIAAMDHPFRGHVSIGPDAFVLVYDRVMKPSDTVSTSMAALVADAVKLGAPKLEGREPLAGKDVPGLYFGPTKMNNFFDVVDEVVKENGGTAALFVRAGDEYVCVATNMKKDDGSRAIGTVLDAKGPAIEMINKGEAFFGEVSILGKPYITGYLPIKDASDHVIGIYYVGYMK